MLKRPGEKGGESEEQKTPQHSEIDGLQKGDVIQDRWGEIEGICKAAFKDPGLVFERIQTDTKKSDNPDRIFSRYYGLLDTLFREHVFQDNDTAWKKITRLTEPGRIDVKSDEYMKR